VVFYNQIVPFLLRTMSSLLRSFAWITAVLLALPLAARADDDYTDAINIAHTWLGEIDAGNYDQSYTDGGSALHDKVPQTTWVRILKTERPLLGKVVNRQVISHEMHPDGLEGAPGTFLVLGYKTAFDTKPEELEYVVLKREFGGWRCVGYDFGPAQVQNNPDEGPTTTTTTEKLTPPVPTNGIVVPAKPGATSTATPQ
jgi:hypothetical protein